MSSEFQEPQRPHSNDEHPESTSANKSDTPPDNVDAFHDERDTVLVPDEGLDNQDALLEKRLSEPVLRGEAGIENAQLWIAAFLVAMAGVIAYSNAFSIPFHAEDARVIVDNRAAHSLRTVPESTITGVPKFLTMMTFALNWSMFGESPAGFHGINIALHVLNGVLVFFLCRRMISAETPIAIPMLAGLLFVLHPLATESVNYIIGRGPLLGTCFTLSSLLLYLASTENPNELRLSTFGWSLLCAFLAWATYSGGIAAPILIILIDMVRTTPVAKPLRGYVRGAFILLLVAIGIYEGVAGEHIVANRTVLSHSLTYSITFLRSIQMTILPIGLTVDHALSVLSETWESGALPSLALTFVIVAAGIVLLRSNLVPGAAILWMVVASAATYFMADTTDVYVERRSYLALAGFVLIIPSLMSLALPYRNGFRNVSLAIVAAALALGVATFMRNDKWQTETQLWADARTKNPNSPRALKWLAHSEVLAGQQARIQAAVFEQQQNQAGASASQELALTNFRSAEDRLRNFIEVHGDDVGVYRDLGYALRGLGRMDEAIESLMKALQLDTQNQQVTFGVASLWDLKGIATRDRFDQSKAIDYFRRTEALGPLSDDALLEYGLVLGANNQWQDAVERLQLGMQRNPNPQVQARIQEFAKYSAAQQQLEGQLEQVLATAPLEELEKPEVLAKSAKLLMFQGKHLLASYVLTSLLTDNPNNLPLWLELGLARAKMKMTDVFVAEFPNAPVPESGVENPWIQLARMCGAEGRWTEAEKYLASEPAKARGTGLPLLIMADIAMNMKQMDVAGEFLGSATREFPNDPSPWLKIAEIALGLNNQEGARRALSEAERRGATPADVEAVRSKLGAAPAAEEQKPVEEQEFILR